MLKMSFSTTVSDLLTHANEFKDAHFPAGKTNNSFSSHQSELQKAQGLAGTRLN